jgi:hypothetical protein
MRNRIVLGVALVSFVSLGSGCGLLLEAALGAGSSSGSQGASSSAAEDPVDVAYKARDLAALQAQCAGKTSLGDGSKRRACDFAQIVDAEDTKDCTRVVDLYDKGPSYNDRDFVVAMGKQFARCDLADPLFERIAPWGRGGILEEVEKSGAPLESLFVKYASTHPGAKFLAGEKDGFASAHVFDWLIGQDHKGQCRLLATTVAGASDNVRRNAVVYFQENGCKEGVAFAIALLTSASASSRAVACTALGEIGDPGIAGKLAVLGDTDGYAEVQEQGDYAMRVYPVRDACRAAAGKIALRAK